MGSSILVGPLPCAEIPAGRSLCCLPATPAPSFPISGVVLTPQGRRCCLALPAPKTCCFSCPFPWTEAVGTVPTVAAAARGRCSSGHAISVCSSACRAGSRTGLPHPQNSATSRPSVTVGKQNSGGQPPGCLSATPVPWMRPHRLGEPPRRSKDKPSALRFSQWTGIFSSGLVAARPRRLRRGEPSPRGLRQPGEGHPVTDRSTFCPGLAQRRLCVPPSRHHPSRANLTAGSRALIPRRLRITPGRSRQPPRAPTGPGKSCLARPCPSSRLCGVLRMVWAMTGAPPVAQMLASLSDGWLPSGYRYP